MLSLSELKNPEHLVRIRFNKIKQKIAKEWDAKRYVNQVGYIDLENEEQIFSYYNEIKPLLFKGFYEDFPDDSLTPRNMKIWLGQNAIAFGNMKDKEIRNIWIDLRECFMLLWEYDMLDVDDEGNLV